MGGAGRQREYTEEEKEQENKKRRMLAASHPAAMNELRYTEVIKGKSLEAKG